MSLSLLNQYYKQDQAFGYAVNLVISTQKASKSFIQKKLELGFARSAIIFEQLIELNIISYNFKTKKFDVNVKNIKDFDFVALSRALKFLKSKKFFNPFL